MISSLRRGVAAVAVLLLGVVVQAVPAPAGTPAPGDTVIDSFTSAPASVSACGGAVYNYQLSPTIAGGAREISAREAGSCTVTGGTRVAVDAVAGTTTWFTAYSPERGYLYGTEIGRYGRFPSSPNLSKGVPLNLALHLDDQIVVQRVDSGANVRFTIRLRDGGGSTYERDVNFAAGTNTFALSTFPGLTAAAAGDIDGVSFFSYDATQGTVSLFAIRGGNTAPSVAVTGVTGTSYEIGAVPAAGCAIADVEDGSSTSPATLSPISGALAPYGLGSRTATCSYTDAGGLSASASVTYTVVDTVGPTLSGAATTSPNAAGWYQGPVTIRWTAVDGGSGIASAPGDSTIQGDGTGLTATATARDHAGNEVSATSPPVDIDSVAPAVTYSGGGSYGLLADVAVTCTATDDLSGIASSSCPSASGPAWSFGPGTHSLQASATDAAGNSSSAATSFRATATTSSLCGLVQVFTTDNGTRTSLCAHLTNVERSRARGQDRPAAAQLDAFRAEVAARSGRTLTASQATTLLAWASTL